MASLLRHVVSEQRVEAVGTSLRVGTADDLTTIYLTYLDLPEIGQLYTRLLKDAVLAARKGEADIALAEVKALIDRCTDHADKLGSALIEIRDEAKQREGRLMPPGVAEIPPEAGTKG